MGTISAPLTSHFLGTDRRYSFHSLSLVTTFFTSLVLITIFDYTSGTETSIKNQVSTVSAAIYYRIANALLYISFFTYLILIAICKFTSLTERQSKFRLVLFRRSPHLNIINTTLSYLLLYLPSFNRYF